MSKRPGRIERAIAKAFAAHPGGVFTVEDLVRLAYPDAYAGEAYEHAAAYRQATGAPEPGIVKKHRVAVLRAAHKVAARAWWVAVPRRYRDMFAEHDGSSTRIVFANALDLGSYATAQRFDGKAIDALDQPQAQPGGKWWLAVERAKAQAIDDPARAADLEQQLQAVEKAEDEAWERYIAPMRAYVAQRPKLQRRR